MIWNIARCGKLFCCWHLKYNVGFLNSPTRCPMRRRRRIGRTSLGSARRDPRRDSLDLLRRQRRIVCEVPAARIGKPWRHGPLLHGIPNGSRIEPRLAVCFERHRRHVTFAMTRLAARMQNGQDVFVESRSRAVCTARQSPCGNGEENLKCRSCRKAQAPSASCDKTRAACWATAVRACA